MNISIFILTVHHTNRHINVSLQELTTTNSSIPHSLDDCLQLLLSC